MVCHALKSIFTSKAANRIKIRLFRAAIESILCYGMESILCYGMESIPLTPTPSRSIDSRYRRMLRSALGIFYPDRISNDELFAKTQLPPLSTTLRRLRLRLVGHILRMQTRSKSPLGELLLNSESEFLKVTPKLFRRQDGHNHASGLLRSSAEVVQAARAEEWCKVRDVLVGHPDLRVTLEPRHQREVLEDAMTKGAWSFIYDLVVDRFYFAPRTLDVVVLTAVRKRYFHFAESVILKTMKIYTFDEIVLYEVFRAFCSLDL
ncbi:hypothetical protein ACOMHN_004311 [Nucella lapillus]